MFLFLFIRNIKHKFSRYKIVDHRQNLLCNECILFSISLWRDVVDRGLWTLVSGILFLIRDIVGDESDWVGLAMHLKIKF